MIVEKLIERLQEMDPDANVVLDGESDDTVFALRAAEGDDDGRFVILVRGTPVPVKVEESDGVA